MELWSLLSTGSSARSVNTPCPQHTTPPPQQPSLRRCTRSTPGPRSRRRWTPSCTPPGTPSLVSTTSASPSYAATARSRPVPPPTSTWSRTMRCSTSWVKVLACRRWPGAASCSSSTPPTSNGGLPTWPALCAPGSRPKWGCSCTTTNAPSEASTCTPPTTTTSTPTPPPPPTSSPPAIAALFAAHAAIVLGHVREVTNLREALTTRQLIGQATGVIMERYGMSPDNAFAYLVRLSSTSNIKLRDVVTALLEQAASETGYRAH